MENTTASRERRSPIGFRLVSLPFRNFKVWEQLNKNMQGAPHQGCWRVQNSSTLGTMVEPHKSGKRARDQQQ
jgi:hypothetical protein